MPSRKRIAKICTLTCCCWQWSMMWIQSSHYHPKTSMVLCGVLISSGKLREEEKSSIVGYAHKCHKSKCNALWRLPKSETSMPASDSKPAPAISRRQCLTSNRITAATVSMLALVSTTMGLTLSKDFYIPATMLWIASGLLWWTCVDACTIGKDLNS